MTRAVWQHGSFVIRTGIGHESVDGLTYGAFGVRLEERRRPIWTVTHLASGMRATPGGGGFTNLELAKTFAERLLALTDWSSIDRNAVNAQLGDQVVAIWNELIARDVATTFANHYGADLTNQLRKRNVARRGKRN